MKTSARHFVLRLGNAALLGLAFASAAFAAESPPREITVLLLPALDATPDAANMIRPRQAVIRHRQQVEFLGREFRVMGEALALRAAREVPAIELTSVAARTPEGLDALARRTQADWVVHTVVQSAEANPDGAGFAVDTRLLVQVWDARRHDWILNRITTGQVRDQGAPPLLFLRSLDAAAKESLRELLEPVPVVVRLQAEESLVDYLAEQTAPVAGDRVEPFAPLAGGQ